jgi:glycosyltransferase involved in cell wall biosynthesis
MHVAVVTETYPPEINGVANTLSQVVQGLTRRGHRLALVRPRQGPADRPALGATLAELLVPGLPLPRYPGLRFGLPAGRRLLGHWRRYPPDVAYIATEGPLGRSALRAATRLGVPALTGFHTQFHQYCRHYGLGMLERLIAASLRRFHNRAALTLVPTRELAGRLERAGYRNTRVFSRGVDTHLFSPARRDPALRARWGAGEHDLVVLYVGRLAAEKNLGLAVRAYDAIAQGGCAGRFVLVGHGPATEPLRAARPDFVFTGPQRGLDLARSFASADLFLFPSMTETFGNVVAEAMASGLPVVAYDYAAAHEHLRHGESGLLVPFGREEEFVMTGLRAAGAREDLRAMGARARETAEGLGWDRVIAELEGLLRTAAEHGRSRTLASP